MKKAVQILLLSAFLLTFMITKSINVMQDTEEIWKVIPGYPKYEASTLGRIRSIERELTVFDPSQNHYYKVVRGQYILKPQPNWRGYLRVDLRSTDRKSGKTECVHRLVALTFIPNPNNYPQINHISAIKEDNSVNNLEWCTNLQNNRHARKLGLYDYAMVKMHQSRMKLDEMQVKTIRSISKNEVTRRQLANYFKIGIGTIKDIRRGKTWVHIQL